MEYKLFKNKFQLWKYLGERCSGVDVNTTLRMPFFWIVMEDGSIYKNQSASQFAKTFNELFDFNLDAKLSYRSGKNCMLFFSDVEKEVKVLSDTDIKALVGHYTPILGADVVEVKTPDWEWINSLKSTQSDKKRLDDYALKHYDIELRRNKKLQDMIEDFKEALEAKG